MRQNTAPALRLTYKQRIPSMRNHSFIRLVILLVLTISIQQKTLAQAPPKDKDHYLPGFSEMMAGLQLRHAKLWFAGQNENWPLAEFEVDEIVEGLNDIVVLRPKYKGKSIVEGLTSMVADPLQQLNTAVTEKDRLQFERAFDSLSQACNACHTQQGIAFIKIQRPTSPPLTNQQYTP